MNKKRILSNPKILKGKPIIAGTRLAVETIMDFIAVGMSTEDILDQYPFLTKQDIQAAAGYAASRIKNEEIHPIIKRNGEFTFANL